MLTLRLAWRSVFRHKRRSIITSAAVALGLAMMLVFVGLSEDGHLRMIDMGIGMGAGHVQIHGIGYRDEQTLDFALADPAPAIEAARRRPEVERIAPRVRAGGLLSAGGLSSAVSFSGVDPRVEPEVSTIASPRRRVEGAYVRPTDAMPYETEPGDIYLGDELARKLEVTVGDRVVLTASPRGASRPSSMAFTVSGLFHTGLDELDGFYAEIALDQAQELLALDGAVTEISLVLDSLDATHRVARELQAELPGADVVTWQQTLSELYEAIVLDDASMYVLMAIVFVIVGIGIFNTMLMSVIERTRELGVMMAIGTSARRVFGMIAAEAALIGVLAVAVGLAIGLGIHAWLASTGLDLAALYGEDLELGGVVMEGRMYSHLTAAIVAQWTVVVFAICVASALYPAWRATRLNPVEAMRHA